MTASVARPLFATPDIGEQARNRLLVISYHFPPDSAVGARRWEKLATYVAERDWGLDCITRIDGDPAVLDSPRLRALPSGVRVYGVPVPALPIQRVEQWTWERLRALRSRGRGNAGETGTSSPNVGAAVTAPTAPTSIAREDIRWGLTSPRGYFRAYWAWLEFAEINAWCTDVVRLAQTIARPETHLAIVTSGPPHMSHDAGRRLSVATGIPFVMDMRDPWSNVERLSENVASPLWLQLAERCERRAVDVASLIVTNTELASRGLRDVYPARRDDIITAMNGVDEDPIPPSRRGGKFVISHAGTVYLDRDPRALFQAAARVIRELQLRPEDIGLEFIGELEAVGGFPIREVAEQEGIADYVQTGPPRPYAQAMEFMANATMLIVMSGTNAAAIPAKTFECIRFDAWILALSAPGSATEALLEGTSADVLAPKDAEGIAQAIRTHYQEHVSGVAPLRIANDDRFSRRGQALRLLTAIEERSSRRGGQDHR